MAVAQLAHVMFAVLAIVGSVLLLDAGTHAVVGFALEWERAVATAYQLLAVGGHALAMVYALQHIAVRMITNAGELEVLDVA